MATGTHTQTNFTAGEISPRLLNRSDLGKYGNGVRLLRNFIPQKHGGVVNRTGTRFVAAAKNSGTAIPTVSCCDGDSGEIDKADAVWTDTIRCRLIPFQFSVTQTYVIELGHNYIRFYKDDGQVLSGGSPYEIVSPYSGSELDDIKFTQSADVLYLCHPDHSPRQLNRFADDNWTLTLFDFSDGPYGEINSDSTKLMAVSSAAPGSVTLTASGAGWGGTGPFTVNHVESATQRGLRVRIKTTGTDWGWGYVTAFTSSFVVTLQLEDGLASTATTSTWRLGEWNAEDGYPWVPQFHQGRLWFGGRNLKPQTLWASTSDNFTLFQPNDPDTEVLDDADGLDFTINDDQVNAIYWLISTQKGLMVGTSGGEFVASSSDVTSGIAPTNIQILRQSARGAHPQARPVQVGNSALFVQRYGRKLREMIYSFEQDSHVSPDLTLISEHITADRIRWVSYMAEPSPIVWMSDEEGGLLSMTYEREQEVAAWARHKLGGSYDGDDAFVESIAVVPEDDFDRLWMVVKRTIDGAEVRYIEYLTDPFETGDTLLRDAIFVDSSLTYDGWNTEVCNRFTLTSPSSSSSSSSASSSSGSSNGGEVDDPWAEDSEGFLDSSCFTPFTAGSVGRRYRFDGNLGDGDLLPIDVEVLTYISPTRVRVRFLNDIPIAMQDVPLWHWSLTASVIGGLDHLEGQTVAVLVDGATHPNVVVSGGEADLNLGSTATEFATYGGVVHVGLPYNSDMQTLPIVAELGFDSRSRQKGLYKATVRFHETVGSRVGVDFDNLDPVPFREGDALQGQHVDLFTGSRVIPLEGRYDTDVQMVLRQSDPLPCTLLGISYDLDINAV